MALKRKRSSSTMSSASFPHSFGSPTSPVLCTSMSPSPSPSHFLQSHNHDISMSNYHLSNCPSLLEDSRPYLHSRTRKRVRNKPDESSIHGTILTLMGVQSLLTVKSEKTYQILFAAAHSPPPPPPPPSIPAPSIPSRSPTSHRQPSLHAFWTLPAPPSSASRTPSPPPSLTRPACQDCDGPLRFSPDTDICMGGMDDAVDEREFSCRVCARLVCETCAVVEVGIGRECSGCTRRVDRSGGTTWVGGIGWMP